MSTPEIIRETLLSAVARGDLQAAVACYTPDAVLTAPEGRFQGSAGIAEYYRAQFDAFSDIRLEVSAAHDGGDVGVAEWTVTGTSTGPVELPGGAVLPPTGHSFTQRGADVAVIAHGRIGEHRLYYDQVELMQQLEAAPAAGR